MNVSDFDYELPEELIAAQPLAERSASRMLFCPRDDQAIHHQGVADILQHLTEGDALVVNNTRVIPARVNGIKKDTGGKVELLFVEPDREDGYRVMLKSSRRPSPGQALLLGTQQPIEVTFVEDLGAGLARIQILSDIDPMAFLDREGRLPLPPYIEKARENTPAGPVSEGTPAHRSLQVEDRTRYQTVFAETPGAVAAPTAGLHFTPELLKALEDRGVSVVSLTLHVGPGTFQPVKVESVADHQMHYERYELSEAACAQLVATQQGGGRICCVGTTCVRTLEAIAHQFGELRPASGETNIFITPGWEFKAVDGLLTNFHLPRSTLLMLVSAFGGYEKVMNAYRIAIENEYRFYSYGDCMLVI